MSLCKSNPCGWGSWDPSLHVDVTTPFTLCHLTSMASSSLLAFLSSILFSVSVEIQPLWLGVLGPITACRCDHSFHSLPSYVNGFLFYQLLQGLELIGKCDVEFLPFFGIIQKKVLYTKRWFVLSVQLLLSLSFNRATRRWWSDTTSAPRLTRTS